jgi:hypothetical protein
VARPTTSHRTSEMPVNGSRPGKLPVPATPDGGVKLCLTAALLFAGLLLALLRFATDAGDRAGVVDAGAAAELPLPACTVPEEPDAVFPSPT